MKKPIINSDDRWLLIWHREVKPFTVGAQIELQLAIYRLKQTITKTIKKLWKL